MVAFADVLDAYKRAANSSQKKIISFDLYNYLYQLLTALNNKTYHPGRFNCFVTKDPKVREIFSPDFRDRIVHYLLIKDIADPIHSQFIYDAHANRKYQGCHLAVKRVQKMTRQSPAKSTSFLQIDVQSYFTTINKDHLFAIIKTKILQLKEMPLQQKNWLLNQLIKIIFQNPADNPIFTGNKHLLRSIPPEKSLFHQHGTRGLPIGSLTSQFFSALYLNELDQFVKHTLKIQRYVRYVDDIVVISESTQDLIAYSRQIDEFLQEKLALKLHPQKTHLQPAENGCDFLGYIIRPHYILVRKRTIKAFKKRLYFFNHLLDKQKFPHVTDIEGNKLYKFAQQGLIIPGRLPSIASLNHMLAVINSYYGLFGFAKSYGLRRNLYLKHFHFLTNYFYPVKSYSKLKMKPIKVLLKEGIIEI